MAVVGYARVSSVGQSLDIQLDKLKGAGCDRVYSEKQSGATAKDRPQLQAMLDYVRDGDTVVITKLDRMGRSLADLLDIVNTLKAKGVSFKVLDQSIDTSTPQGILMLSMLGAFAEFELSIRKERQMEGIARAKEEGKYTGRPKTIDEQPIREALLAGMSIREAASKLGIGKTSVHKVAVKMREEGQEAE
ncbi:resolvase [Citrobacter sp. NCU1]|uniref:recombinase family protein n=1 Tax=Citrobacter sp. NCU1 TaxID=2026683 RepID=UPI0013917B4E|nr:recombinase family protein [Citrobacter sp. NCU1]NDO83171.1 resolvase [Citrobacter sp. NCU1]